MIAQASGDGGRRSGGDVAATIDRELGAISQRLSGIERRLDDGDRDITGLTKTTTNLTIAVAGLSARIADLADDKKAGRAHEAKMAEVMERIADRMAAAPPVGSPGMSPASVAAIAVPIAGGGSVIGAAIWTKIATLMGLAS